MSDFDNNKLNNCFDLIKDECNHYNEFSKKYALYNSNNDLKCDSFEMFKKILQQKRKLLDHEKNLFNVDITEYFETGYAEINNKWNYLKNNIGKDLINDRSSFINDSNKMFSNIRQSVSRSSSIKENTSNAFKNIKADIINKYEDDINTINKYFLNLFYFLLNYSKEKCLKETNITCFNSKYIEDNYIILLELLNEILLYFKKFYFKITLFKTENFEDPLYTHFIDAFFDQIQRFFKAKSQITFISQSTPNNERINNIRKLILNVKTLLLINHKVGGKSRSNKKRLNKNKQNTKTRMRKGK